MTSEKLRSLTGKRIVLTRARHQINQIETQLFDYGATSIPIPTIEIADPPDLTPINRVFAEGITPIRSDGFSQYGRLKYEWVIFTSANGVERFISHRADWMRRHSSEGIGLNDSSLLSFDNVKFAAIGPGTAHAMTEIGLDYKIYAEDFVAEGLVEKFQEIEPDSSNEFKGHVLLPRALKARNILPDSLRKMGWVVEDVPVYQTILPKVEAGSQELLSSADAIVFMSSSTVRNFIHMFGKEYLPEVIVSIGPITSQTILDCGFTHTIQASPSSIEGIVAGLIDYYASN
tara:strand:- start:566 stop:1429 length:864 start_codon:yes stop_codon:yes gene_type:complete